MTTESKADSHRLYLNPGCPTDTPRYVSYDRRVETGMLFARCQMPDARCQMPDAGSRGVVPFVASLVVNLVDSSTRVPTKFPIKFTMEPDESEVPDLSSIARRAKEDTGPLPMS